MTSKELGLLQTLKVAPRGICEWYQGEVALQESRGQENRHFLGKAANPVGSVVFVQGGHGSSGSLPSPASFASAMIAMFSWPKPTAVWALLLAGSYGSVEGVRRLFQRLACFARLPLSSLGGGHPTSLHHQLSGVGSI
jgi:hypothetical protein